VPSREVDDAAFGPAKALGTPYVPFSRLYFTRLTRSRTYASPDPLPSRFCPLTCMSVARLATDLPGQLWSDGIRTRKMTLPYFFEGDRTSLSYGPAFPGRTSGSAL
jgi:hypothetical protein